ncbi:TolC family protein [Myxococcota bacterium]|nr:TolC family protein [Myxococcota bacterium]
MKNSYPAALFGALILLLCQVSLTNAQEPSDVIEVGNIQDLDLDRFRKIIDQSDDVGPPPATTRRSLSLRESVQVALQHNLDIQIARLDLDILVPEVAANEAKFDPTPGFTASYSGSTIFETNRPTKRADAQEVIAFIRQELPTGGQVEIGGGYQRSFDNGEDDNFDAPRPSTSEIAGLRFGLRHPLLKGARTYVARSGIQNSELDRDVSSSRLRSQVLRVTAETKAAYYDAILSERLIEVIQQAIQRDHQLLEYSEALFKSGRVSQRDVISAKINLTSDSVKQSSRLAARELAQTTLRNILGLPIDQQIEIEDETVPFRPVKIELERWIREALEQRPEIAELKAELERARLKVRIRGNGLLPRFDAFGRYDQGADWESNEWIVGTEFEIPFGNVAAKSRLKSAENEQKRVERLLVKSQRSIETEVRQTEIRLRANILQLRDLATGVEQARTKRSIARGRFQQGLANNFDVTDADRDLVEAQSSLLAAVVQYASNLAFLEAAIARPI